MSVFTPTKMPVPSWMKMNDMLIAYDTRMEDAENTIENFSEEEKNEMLINSCAHTSSSVTGWYPRNPGAIWSRQTSRCSEGAMKKPELQMKHLLCQKAGSTAPLVRTDPRNKNIDIQAVCDMYNFPGETIFPEYAHCVKPGGLQYTDCQIACYGYPDQKGCEAIKAMGLSEAQRKSIIWSLKSGKPIKPPAPATKVNVEATLKSVKPGAIEISYTDPNTKTSKVVTKTLVDMYKPGDSVAVIIAKPAGTFLGFHRK
jgi:hypothetical protein